MASDSERKPDFYEILGVARDASPEVIRKAYQRLAKELHPDRNKAPDAADRLAQVNVAYEALSDEKTRATYDEFGTTEDPVMKMAVETLTTKVSELIDSETIDIVRSMWKWIEDQEAALSRNRLAANRDIDRINSRRRLLRRKGKAPSMFDRVFDHKVQRAKNALESMDHQSAILARMRTIFQEYESEPDSWSSLFLQDPTRDRNRLLGL